MFRLVTFSVQFGVYLVEFVLSILPEPKPRRPLYQLGLDDEVHQLLLDLMLVISSHAHTHTHTHSQRKPCPEEQATFLSRITWWWQNGQIWHGWRRPLKYEDLTDLNSYDKSEVIAPVFQKHWDKELQKSG